MSRRLTVVGIEMKSGAVRGGISNYFSQFDFVTKSYNANTFNPKTRTYTTRFGWISLQKVFLASSCCHKIFSRAPWDGQRNIYDHVTSHWRLISITNTKGEMWAVVCEVKAVPKLVDLSIWGVRNERLSLSDWKMIIWIWMWWGGEWWWWWVGQSAY